MLTMQVYNSILENLVLPAGDFALRTSFMRHLRRLRREVQLSEQQLNELQARRLEHVLQHATQHAMYYRRFRRAGRKDVHDWLRSFPVLDKHILRERQHELLTMHPNRLVKASSSGSSGMRSEVYMSRDEQSCHRATQVLFWEWAGYKLGMPIVQTGMTPERGIVKGTKDKLLRTFYFPAFVPEEKPFQRALDWASRKPQVFLGGYASSLYVLSKIAKRTNQTIHFCSACSWGDKLFDHYRNAIQDAFSAKVYETYGAAEGLMIAAQKDLPYMYLMTPNVYLELLDEHGNPVPDGEMGHVVVTSLVAKAMPLIRYKIGDLAIRLPKDAYPPQRELALPILQKVIGRDTDIVRTANGKYMVVHSFTGIFEHIAQIHQFRVVQESLAGITIEYIPAKGFTEQTLKMVAERIQAHLREPDFAIHFCEVSHIPASPSGKPQIIVSKLQPRAEITAS